MEWSLAVIGLHMYIVQSTSSELTSVVVGGDFLSLSASMSSDVTSCAGSVALPTIQDVQCSVM